MKSAQVFSLFLFSGLLWAQPEESLKKLNWGGLEVLWHQDERFPTYTLTIYFADGALGDQKIKGSTEAAFDLLTAGTRRFSQKDIEDNLEFFGTSYRSYVVHEFSAYTVAGLVENAVPSVKKICHLFKDATYPKAAVKQESRRAINYLSSLRSNPSALATMAFREVSLEGSPFAYPSSGKIRDLKRLNSKALQEQLKHLTQSVKKRIYLNGPSGILKLEKVIKQDCGFNPKAHFVRTVEDRPIKQRSNPKIVLVENNQINQAEIRLGKAFNLSSSLDPLSFDLVTKYLGGGFSSLLMEELRTKRGLVYSASAVAGSQKYYGRSVIGTATAVNNVEQVLSLIKTIVEEVRDKGVNPVRLEFAKNAVAGSHPFQFEVGSRFLYQILDLDHRNRPYSELFNYPNLIKAQDKTIIEAAVEKLYSFDDLSIVVVGPRELLPSLKKWGVVNVKKPSSFLQ